MTLLLGLALAAAPAFLQPAEVRIHASEESDEQALVELCHLPGAQLELTTRSNMLASGVVEALRRCRRPIVDLRLPLLPVHRERLEKLPGAEVAVELGERGPADLSALTGLGPRRLHVRVQGVLDDARAAALARLRDVEVELDLRGRVPDAQELARFRRLDRADRSVRLDARASPELIAGLRALRPARVVVESAHNVVPAQLRAALDDSGLPVRVVMTQPLSAQDLAPLATIRRIAVELDVGSVERVPRSLTDALAPLEPDRTPPGGHAAPGPELPAR